MIPLPMTANIIRNKIPANKKTKDWLVYSREMKTRIKTLKRKSAKDWWKNAKRKVGWHLHHSPWPFITRFLGFVSVWLKRKC